MRKIASLVCLLLIALPMTAFGQEKPVSQPTSPLKENWINLFDGKTLDNWAKVKNYGTGDVLVQEGAIELKTGSTSTAIRYDNTATPFPTTRYEIEYVAERVEGSDFFAALTFPVGKNVCTLINGGWGGTLVGLSSINGMDASENSTSTWHDFKNKVRYRFRVAVTDDSITVWIDDEQAIATVIKDSTVSIRFEMELCKPLGFATWICHGAIYSIRYRHLDCEEAKALDEIAHKNEYSFDPNK